MDAKKKILISILILILAPAIVIAALTAGLYLPRLLAQELPPQLPKGAIGTIQLENTGKCEVTIRYTKTGDLGKEAAMKAAPQICNRTTGEEFANQLTSLIQESLDHCILVSSLPDDDPDKAKDPATKSLYWEFKLDGLNYLCNHLVDVFVKWDGSVYDLQWKSVN